MRRVKKRISKVLKTIPVVSILPLAYEALDEMDDETKKEIITNLLIAGAKMAAKHA